MMTQAEIREALTFENEGKKLFGVWHKPAEGNGPFPGVVICHGLGGTKVGRFRLYVRLAEALAKAGIATFRFDFRGSGDSEGRFYDMSISSEKSDAVQAVRFFEEHPEIDKNRIGLLGRSLGGMVAVLAAAELGDTKSLALLAPPYSGKQWEEQWNIVQDPNTTDEERKEMMKFGTLPTFKPFLEELFTLQIAKEMHKIADVPMFHIHGEQDQAIHPTHADDYEGVRSDATAETEMVRLPNSDHDFSHEDEQKEMIKKTVAWFLQTL